MSHKNTLYYKMQVDVKVHEEVQRFKINVRLLLIQMSSGVGVMLNGKRLFEGMKSIVSFKPREIFARNTPPTVSL